MKSVFGEEEEKGRKRKIEEDYSMFDKQDENELEEIVEEEDEEDIEEEDEEEPN